MASFVGFAAFLCLTGTIQAAPEAAPQTSTAPASGEDAAVAAERPNGATDASAPAAPEPAAEGEPAVEPKFGAGAPPPSPALAAPDSEPATASPPSEASYPQPAAASSSTPADPSTESSGTDWAFVGGLITLAGGVGLLVAGHYGLFRLEGAVREEEMRSYRQGVPEGESACEYARSGFASGAEGSPDPGAIVDLCDEADSMEVLRNVALPIGVAATVAGLLLIGTSDTVNGAGPSEQARSWHLRVGVGPQGGSATATVRF